VGGTASNVFTEVLQHNCETALGLRHHRAAQDGPATRGCSDQCSHQHLQPYLKPQQNLPFRCQTPNSWFVNATCCDEASLHQGGACLRPRRSGEAASHTSFPCQGNQDRGHSKAAARDWDSSSLLWWQCLCGFSGQNDNKQGWQGRKRGHLIYLLLPVPPHGFVAPEIKQDSRLWAMQNAFVASYSPSLAGELCFSPASNRCRSPIP